MQKITAVVLCLCFITGGVWADTFGTGANQITIDFVSISNETNPSSGSGSVAYNYRMSQFEISNDQWDKFSDAYGTVTGDPSNAYNADPYFTGSSVPTNEVSWYEAAQFVNWLNTSKGYTAAYKFTGSQGTGDYTFSVWDVADTGYDASNPYRNSNAFYFLPTEEEWVKAAYWNGTNLQTYATTDNTTPIAGTETNYDTASQPWNVGNGAGELNGTYDMMGNVLEWMEGPYNSGNYLSDAYRCVRGGSYEDNYSVLESSSRYIITPTAENLNLGFRVASIPEPCSLVLLSLGSLVLRQRINKRG